jgi:hypothetical protein
MSPPARRSEGSQRHPTRVKRFGKFGVDSPCRPFRRRRLHGEDVESLGGDIPTDDRRRCWAGVASMHHLVIILTRVILLIFKRLGAKKRTRQNTTRRYRTRGARQLQRPHCHRCAAHGSGRVQFGAFQGIERLVDTDTAAREINRGAEGPDDALNPRVKESECHALSPSVLDSCVSWESRI